MEQFTFYLVQFWTGEPYNYWATTSEPSENMFGMAVSEYATAAEAEARRDALVAKYPNGKYRVIERTVTDREI